MKAIEHVVSIAKSAAGRSATRVYGIYFLNAIPKDQIQDASFREIRWPRLMKELLKAGGVEHEHGLPADNS